MERENPKVSVIVPVYKAESYLHKCVDSLLAQTFTDFEVILVDDGSPDRSGEICDGYVAKDSRVRVIHKENGGVSSARQCGMDNARGEYTIHADPDDWVEPNMLEELYRKAKEEDADMVICDYYEDRKGESIYVKQQPSALDCDTVIRELFQQLHGSCWNKLVKRVCYRKNNIKFPSGINRSEDLIFILKLLVHPIKIGYVNKAFYHYVQDVNVNTLSRQCRLCDYLEAEKCRKAIEQIFHLYNGLNTQSLFIQMEKNQAYFALVGHFLSASQFYAKYRPLLRDLSLSINPMNNENYIKIALYQYHIGVCLVKMRLFIGKIIHRR